MSCKGLRPKFGPGIPDCYIELANQCMDSDPKIHPTSNGIIYKLNKWLEIIGYEFKDKDKDEWKPDSRTDLIVMFFEVESKIKISG